MGSIQVAAETDLWTSFPPNQYIQRLLDCCRTMEVTLAHSPVPEQWLYHPAYRSIYVWEPDLSLQSLSFLTVILAHELGHAVDFDSHPGHVAITCNLHWSQTPAFIERAAFVNGFLILKDLCIPISIKQYAAMIDGPMAGEVIAEVERDHLCCLLSRSRRLKVAGAAPAPRLQSTA